MDSDGNKMPLKEDCRYFLDFGQIHRKRSRKVKTVAAVSLILVLIVSVIILNIYTFTRIQKLENEVETLKRTFSAVKILDDEFYNAIQKFQQEELYAEELTDDDNENLFMIKPDELNDYYDYDTAEPQTSSELDQIEDIELMLKKQTPNEQDETEIREKRNVVAATQDGVLINSESYADVKKRNGTLKTLHDLTITTLPARPSSFGSSPAWLSSRPDDITISPSTGHTRHNFSPPPVYNRRSRVMLREDKSKAFRQVVKKSSLKAGDLQDQSNERTDSPDFTIIHDGSFGRRRFRQRHNNLESLDERPRLGRIKPLPTVHYSGDTSRYVYGTHTNFNGNGHLRHPQRTYVDWKANQWVHNLGMDQHFTMENGLVTIKESGLYFIYAQIYYLDEHDMNGYRVFKNEEGLFQCTTSTHTDKRINKGNTCYTAGVEHLSEGDQISLRDFSEGRYSLFEPGKSFFGLIKLGDIKIK